MECGQNHTAVAFTPDYRPLIPNRASDVRLTHCGADETGATHPGGILDNEAGGEIRDNYRRLGGSAARHFGGAIED
jgi:hypothetical protein